MFSLMTADGFVSTEAKKQKGGILWDFLTKIRITTGILISEA